MGKNPNLSALAAWFERQKRVLPWRDDPSPYRVWISEIMLQQTQVITVVPYFERFLARFPTLESLAAASEDAVLEQWAGLGYYSRARNIHRAARAIHAAGRFPRTREEWLEIPGVGPYTAGAILSIAFDLPEAILDGNVERVLSRLYRLKRDARYKQTLWGLAGKFVRAGERPSVLNQALMELGATVCTPMNPRCAICPLARGCEARRFEEQGTFPEKKKPKQWVAVSEELHCVLDPEGRVLLEKRAEGQWRAGLWDLPAAKPSLRARKLGIVESRHVVTRHKISRTTHVWLTRALGAAESGDARWVSSEKPEVAVGSALKRTLGLVRERFSV